jgi:broad specificity phosphatase PhoE
MYLHVMRHAERSAFLQRSGVWDQQWAEGRARCWDDELTARGKEQAREAARQLLASYGQPRRLLCSPFVRCVETALAVADEIGGGLRVEVDAGLCENMRSEWFGKSGPFDEIMMTRGQLRDRGLDVQSGQPALFGEDAEPKEYEVSGGQQADAHR